MCVFVCVRARVRACVRVCVCDTVRSCFRVSDDLYVCIIISDNVKPACLRLF